MGDTRLMGGLAQGLAQGMQSGTEQARLAEMQKLQKQTLDLQHKWEKAKIDMAASASPEDQKHMMFPGSFQKAGPLDDMRTKLLQNILAASGISTQQQGGQESSSSGQSFPEAMSQKQFNWTAPAAEDVMNYALTGDTKDLVPPARTVDLGNRIGVIRGGRVVGEIPKAIKPEGISIESPGGEKRQVFYDPFKPPETIQTGGKKGAPVSDASKIQLIQTGLEAYNMMQGILYNKEGKIDKVNLMNAAVGTPLTEGRAFEELAFGAMDALQRAATGAAITASEWKQYKGTYVPSVFDSEKQIGRKLDLLSGFLNGYLEKIDPSGAIRVRTGKPVEMSTMKPGENVPPKIESTTTLQDYRKKWGLK
jgi:hypothetical protein